MQAVAGQLVGRDIVAQLAGAGAFPQQIADEVADVLVRPGDVLALVEPSEPRARARSAAKPGRPGA